MFGNEWKIDLSYLQTRVNLTLFLLFFGFYNKQTKKRKESKSKNKNRTKNKNKSTSCHYGETTDAIG
jgi:hypothetical protein